MIYEFALDPKLVSSWHDRREYAFFIGRFGLDAGRLVSAYPKKWRRLVKRAFFDLFPAGNPSAEMRLEALLDTLCANMVKRDGTFSDKSTWLEKAEHEHNERPFRGILSLENPRTHPAVMTVDGLLNDLHRDWHIPPDPTPPRKADEFAQAVAPLLRCCRHAIFIDPYFEPSRSRFRDSVKAMLNVLWNQAYSGEARIAEIHLDAKNILGDEPSQDEIARSQQYFLDQCQRHFASMIPAGRTLKIVFWRAKEGQERLHNRYVLTDIGGVSFSGGLDTSQPGKDSESDDLHRLSSTQHIRRWGQYVSAPAFELVCDLIILPE